ncbi:MAG TPA: hypothetical protein VGP65_01920 [Candidatus Angelobacter sp.]|jgi:hypothetical protein|nr:hypothetical protein [Candidatus Angelobacter sp.]
MAGLAEQQGAGPRSAAKLQGEEKQPRGGVELREEQKSGVQHAASGADAGKKADLRRCYIHWKIVPVLTTQSDLAAKEILYLDQILPAHGTSTLRFIGDEAEFALLSSVSLLLASSQQCCGCVKILGPLAKDGEAQILFLSSKHAVSELNSLLKLIGEKAPDKPQADWIGVPVSSGRKKLAPEIQISGNGVRPSGTLVISDKNKKAVSFALYPLQQSQDPVPELQPVKKILPEPKGNLRARAEWFQRRSGG